MPDDVKFCPYCGHTVLFETDTIRCHGCGMDFVVTEASDIPPDYSGDLKQLKETVQDFIDGRITMADLEFALV